MLSTSMKYSPECRTIQINGKQHYLWRAVDQDGEVVDVYLRAKRDGTAAKRFFRRRLRSHGGEPRKIVTVHAVVQNLFNLSRHLMRAHHFRDLRDIAPGEWSGSLRPEAQLFVSRKVKLPEAALAIGCIVRCVMRICNRLRERFKVCDVPRVMGKVA